jgi:mono/diheme cytochrome c family protein
LSKNFARRFISGFVLGVLWAAPVLFAADGASIYRTNCSPCHGLTGKGDGPASGALNPKPRDHTDGNYMNSLSDEHLFTVITKGGASVKRSSLMPAWGGQLSDEEIREVIKHVRSLARPPYGTSAMPNAK